MNDAYAAAGVDIDQSDRAVDALVGVLRTIELDRPSASVLASGHYASVLRVAPNLGIALSTDGVGSKIVVAERADRLETGGIDLCGTAIGTVALDALVTGEAAAAGDALIGLPSSGLHSNGYTLARRALLDEGALALDDRPAELGGPSLADVLLEPTVIYVRA